MYERFKVHSFWWLETTLVFPSSAILFQRQEFHPVSLPFRDKGLECILHPQLVQAEKTFYAIKIYEVTCMRSWSTVLPLGKYFEHVGFCTLRLVLIEKGSRTSPERINTCQVPSTSSCAWLLRLGLRTITTYEPQMLASPRQCWHHQGKVILHSFHGSANHINRFKRWKYWSMHIHATILPNRINIICGHSPQPIT